MLDSASVAKKFGILLLKTGRAAIKASGVIVRFALDEMTDSVKENYKEKKIDQTQHDEFMEASKKAAKRLDGVSNKLNKIDKKLFPSPKEKKTKE